MDKNYFTKVFSFPTDDVAFYSVLNSVQYSTVMDFKNIKFHYLIPITSSSSQCYNVTKGIKTDLFDYIELVSKGDLRIKGGQNGLGLCYQHDISKVTR